jgi:hypothetical protein
MTLRETSKSLEVSIKEHKYNLTLGLLEKSELAQDEYEKCHKKWWKEAKVLQIEPNATYRKHKKSSHMSLVDNPISQPSWNISTIWTHIIKEVKKKLQLRPV